MASTIGAVFLLLGVVLIVGAVCAPRTSDPHPIGRESRLVSAQGGVITLAVNKQAWVDGADALFSNDRIRLAKLSNLSLYFPIGAGTRVLVTASDQFGTVPLRQVRILEGPNVGQAGWVEAALLSK